MSKNTINLPKTSFSMRANLPEKEPKLIDYWKKIKPNIGQIIAESVIVAEGVVNFLIDVIKDILIPALMGLAKAAVYVAKKIGVMSRSKYFFEFQCNFMQLYVIPQNQFGLNSMLFQSNNHCKEAPIQMS